MPPCEAGDESPCAPLVARPSWPCFLVSRASWVPKREKIAFGGPWPSNRGHELAPAQAGDARDTQGRDALATADGCGRNKTGIVSVFLCEKTLSRKGV